MSRPSLEPAPSCKHQTNNSNKPNTINELKATRMAILKLLAPKKRPCNRSPAEQTCEEGQRTTMQMQTTRPWALSNEYGSITCTGSCTLPDWSGHLRRGVPLDNTPSLPNRAIRAVTGPTQLTVSTNTTLWGQRNPSSDKTGLSFLVQSRNPTKAQLP